MTLLRPLAPRIAARSGAVLLACVVSGASAFAAEPVDFNRDVRPILSQHCFKCHGPDPATREAEMRFDTQKGLFEDRGDSTLFVSGDPEHSEAWRRITSDDESERMPPPEAKRDLTPAKIATIKAWIEQGATWEPHWAFVAPKRMAPPEVKHADRARNPIDRFVLARMEAAGLTPSAEADRYTLIRRVSLDLIGLPPSVEEADAFVNDDRPDAYERLVDRLLASPHYGERWARRWLDLARYADTNGYEKDRPRSIWPYRDWVIDAINAGMPFHKFTVKQLAGDMLPNATTDDLIATGFHRNTMLNEEGGIDPLEFRYHAMTDRVGTTGTTWLGLTTGCAQCHDHKFDPISHREYFGLMAFLNNADEPELPLPDPEREALAAANLEKADRLLRELPSHWPLDEDAGWRTASIVEVSAASGQKFDVLDDGSFLAAAPGPDRDTYTVVVETESPRVDRLRIMALAHDSLPSRGPGRVAHGNFVLSEVAVIASPRSQPGSRTPVTLESAVGDVEQNGFPAAAAIDGDPATGWAVHVPDKPLNADHMLTLALAKPVEHPGGTRFVLTLRQEHGGNHTIGRIRVEVPTETAGAKPDRSRLVERAFQEWLASERASTVEWTFLRPSEASSNLPLLTLQDDDSIFVTGDTTKQDRYEVVFDRRVAARNEIGREGDRESGRQDSSPPPPHSSSPNPPPRITAIRLEALPDDRLPAGGPGMTYYEGTPGDFFLTEFRVTDDGEPIEIASASDSYAKNRFGNNAATAAQAIDGDMQTGWSVDGRQGERHSAVFVLVAPVDAKALNIEMTFGRHFASSLGRFRISVTNGLSPLSPGRGVLKARDLSEETERLLAKPDAELTSAERSDLRDAFLLRAPELEAFAAKIRALRKPPASTTTLVFRERPASNPRPTFIHDRGEYLQPTEEVDAITLEALQPFPDDRPRNRLGLARWLVDEANPLTARVVANRQWATLFGRGIVATVQDFGFQGESPTHPELLDWLAIELMAHGEQGMGNGWDVKRLHRLIVTSATYRQSSVVSSESLERDPSNVWLSRGPRLRLEAELIRDAALVSSGLLSPQMHGEPVRPPQPEGVTEAAYGSPKWNASAGGDRYRRSVYTFIKRTAPFAMFGVFDAPSGEACTAKRDVSNTALQSLTLLNDVMFLEAAQAFGRELAVAKGSDEERVTLAFRRVLTRPPTDAERNRLLAFVGSQRKRFAKGELDPKAFVGSDDASVEQAVWTALARALLSLDEATTRG
ncbi:MAG: PSD1 and planctomycete cytochrome C domain-containing protein [Planctomycetota bacterium]|nr:PSD1 and planctomycete cytochrome C domain-containing protein [Planctomycetota bacterium]